MAQYRKLLKALHSLRDELVAEPTGLVGGILVRLEEAGSGQAVQSLLDGHGRLRGRGIAVATAAAGASAAVLLVSCCAPQAHCRVSRGRLRSQKDPLLSSFCPDQGSSSIGRAPVSRLSPGVGGSSPSCPAPTSRMAPKSLEP